MKRTLLIMVGIALILTAFLFPTSEPGAIIDLEDSAKTLSTCRIVTLSPMFGRYSGRKFYSIVVSPSLNSYAKNVSSSHRIALVKTGVRRLEDGRTFSDWSFEWFYWILIVLLPSTIISFAAWWKSKWPTAKSNER